ncbi:MAG: ATP-binding cassette domain-containing protein [Pontiella sp.]
MADSVLIKIINGALRYKGEGQYVLSQVNMSIAKHQWTSVLGKSGCGKTSLLRFLAGLLDEKVDWSGSVETPLQGDLSQHVAYMAQQDLLMPWLSVMDNVCLRFRLSNKKITEPEKQQATALIEQVGLLDKIHHFPEQLSGGMRQRVALARTLMQDKPLVLMDEPFSALDAVTRYQLQNLSVTLLQNKTIVLITHDPQEALRLSSKIYLMHGQPAQCHSFPVPTMDVPRRLSGEIAQLQQQLIEQLGKNHASS